MCGIGGIFAYGRGATADPDEVERIGRRMSCRGPDGSGTWRSPDGKATLTHRRLAIIDLSDRGSQPMRDTLGHYVISFNGEIYNYRELRTSLESRGHGFLSGSDTEILLRLYADRGAEMVRELSGMFAFAIWDGIRGGLLLARDPFGIKPLYYADDGRQFRLASEVKALIAGGGVATDPEPAGHVGFFLLGSVPEPYTLHRGIRQLPAGSTLWVGSSGPTRITTYTSVTKLLGDCPRPPARLDQVQIGERLRAAATATVRRHLVADVDVGVFLSAGLDSTTLAALAAESGAALRTVTLGFAEYRGTPADETPLAEAVATQYGADHRTIWVTRDDFLRESDRLIDRMDQPSTDGVNTYFVARAAASTGLKVALSGLGGDELFGGYPSFRQLPRLVNALRRVPAARQLGAASRFVVAKLLMGAISPKYASVLEYGSRWPSAYLLRRGLFMPWELPEVLDPDLVVAGLSELRLEERLAETIEGVTDDRLRVSALETCWYMRNQLLRDADWASMSSSLEVRVPLVDWEFWNDVVPLLMAAPNAVTKDAFARTPRFALPSAVMSRPKTGFTIPVHSWIESAVGQRFQGRGSRAWAKYVYERTSGS